MPSTATVKSKTKKMAKTTTKKAVTALARRAPEAKAAIKIVKAARSEAPSGIRRAVNSTSKVVKQHPLAVGTLIGAGVLVGVAAHAMRGSSTSMSDAVDALASGVSRASTQARKSFKKASTSVRKALK